VNRFLNTLILGGMLSASSLAAGIWPPPASAQAGASSARIDSLAAVADRGDADAQYEYGRLHEVGAGDIPIDYQISMEWYSRAAEQDHIPAMLSLSTLLLGSNPGEAMRVVLRAAEIGAAEAQWRAGQVYAGRIVLPLAGINQDQEAARRWFALGAAQGHHPSEEALADLYTNTDERALYSESVELYRRAAIGGGSAWAVLRLGMIHALGEGVEENDDDAREWFSQLGSEYDLDPDSFSNAELDVLGGLQAYYGLDFLSGNAPRDPVAAREAFGQALESVQEDLFRPFIHPSFQRISEGMLEKLHN
jgi:hypothetical protein